MESPQPYAIRYTKYSPQEAANLLLRISFEDTIALPPVKPKAGDVFIFSNKDYKGNEKQLQIRSYYYYSQLPLYRS